MKRKKEFRKKAKHKAPAPQLETIVLARVQVPKDRAKPDEKVVLRLMESIKTQGLLEPITVCRPAPQMGAHLVEGLNRLEACRRLKHKVIKARVQYGENYSKRGRVVPEPTALDEKNELDAWAKADADERQEKIDRAAPTRSCRAYLKMNLAAPGCNPRAAVTRSKPMHANISNTDARVKNLLAWAFAESSRHNGDLLDDGDFEQLCKAVTTREQWDALADEGWQPLPPMTRAALDYASCGWHVFPANVKEKKSYEFAARNGGRRWGATDDPKILKRFFKNRKAGIGIATGPQSGIFVVEADTKAGHAVDGIAELKRLEAEHGKLPKTMTAQSPTGSMHYYLEYPAAVTISNSAGKLAPGVDVRGEGGMVIAPPSVRPNKGEYIWLDKRAPAKAPQWLLGLLGKKEVSGDQAKLNNHFSNVSDYAPTDREKVRAMLFAIPAEYNRDNWLRVAAALKDIEGGEALFHEWGAQSERYNETLCTKGFAQARKLKKITLGTLYHLAREAGWRDRHISPEDFVAYMPMHNYFFLPTREPWPAASVNSQLPPVPGPKDEKGKPTWIPASQSLDKKAPVQQMTWAPGLPMLIKDRLVADGGWIERPGMTCLNLYRPPIIKHGNAAGAQRWADLVKRIYPEDHQHIIAYCAQRVQHPEIKINHGMVLGGPQGIGKDTILEPLKHAVGPWNFTEIDPARLIGRFNGHVKSVVLRVSEGRDLGEVNRYAFYEHGKTLMAAPPDVLRCDEKNLREHAVLNVCGVIITTNHLTDGLYLPEDDRRHFVAWSKSLKSDFADGFWRELWQWYEAGGFEDVAAYLHAYDLSAFDPKEPPPKTEAFWDIVNSNRAPEEAELADVFDKLKQHRARAIKAKKQKKQIAEVTVDAAEIDAVTIDAVTLNELKTASGSMSSLYDWLEDRKNSRAVGFRLEACGYTRVRNPDAKDGLWRMNNARQTIYARNALPLAEQILAARKHTTPPPTPAKTLENKL